MNKKIYEIEQRLCDLMKRDEQSWVEIYHLIKQVEIEELWKYANFHSFSQWLKDFAVRNNIHESTLWQRKRAGEVYEKYRTIKQNRGERTQVMENINIPASSLELIDKIVKNSVDKKEETQDALVRLMDKTMAKEMTRADLREAYLAVRKDPAVRNVKQIPEKNAKIKMATVADIIVSLHNSNWLFDGDPQGKLKKQKLQSSKSRFVSAYQKPRYRLFTEFPIQLHTVKKDSTINALAVENVSTEDALRLHAVEIKVTAQDIHEDHRYLYYAQAADDLYLAVPEELADIAMQELEDGIGLIAVNIHHKARMIQKAAYRPGMERVQTLERLTLRLL